VIELDWAVLLAVFLASASVGTLIVLTERWHGKLTHDHDLKGVQKIHEHPVPRIGGLVVMTGLTAGTLALYLVESAAAPQMKHLLFCCVPTFLAGIWEDITKRVSVKVRLWAAFLSASLAGFLVGSLLSRLNVYGVDDLMVYWPIALLFTVFAVGGFINAVNIIDGLNGLASGSVVLILLGLGILGFRHNDLLVVYMCAIGAATMLGFMVWNYPFGKIFLGDGGAYLTGFWVAECAVLLLARNPSISTWLVLVICLLPVWETVFSMWRRKVIEKTKTDQPDQGHFHHIILRELVQKRLLPAGSPNWKTHGLSSLIIWGVVFVCQLGLWLLPGNEPVALFGGVAFLILYHTFFAVLKK
jgi:UDP-N-acetylmuramyl pentapeptide phosphotransferase/UDP-N-acetylglucosamine-1-phosphate transferase